MKTNYKIKLFILSLLFTELLRVDAQQTYSFTNCGATGVNGPTQGQANTAYLSTNLNGMVSVSGGIQTWTVPTNGLYRISTYGAQGGGSTGGANTGSLGGLGAVMIGDFNLTAGQVLKILVGQEGGSAPYGGGGGGGSYVVSNTNNPMIIAGGGGGGNGYVGYSRGVFAGGCGLITTSGGNSNQIIGAYGAAAPGAGGGAIAMGGTNGFGGGGAVTPGGGGFFNNGGTGSNASIGLGFIQGATGGAGNGGTNNGGFGGGAGGTTSSGYGGGGGGYSGGGGGNWDGTTHGNGGGGGSLNLGVNQTNTSCINPGHGKVIITELCNISLTASTSNSLNPSICSGQSVTLTTNGVSNYAWSTGNTTNSVIVVSPTSTTVYTLSATSVSNCTAYQSITVNVSGAIPLLTVTSSTNQTCFGKTATLTASGALTYTWTNGVINGVSFLPQSTTTYTVSGENGCGITTAVSTISVDPLPVSIVSTHTAICANLTATLSVTAAATSYTWQPGNIINNNPILIVSPQVNTIYTITASDGTCVGVTNISLQSDPVPTVNVSASSTVVCPGGAVTLSVTGGNNYTWTPGNQNGNSISVNPAISTLYNVIGDNTFGCLGNAQQVVVVGTPPNVILTANAYTICTGSSTTLSATGANNYAWINGPNTNSFAVTPNVTSTYTVDGTDTNNPCITTKTIEITVINPVLTISGNTMICNGESTNLTASGVTSYTWAHIGTSGAVTNVAPTSNTSYTVNATETLNNVDCPVSTVVNVVVNPKPIITSVPTRTAICVKETNTLTASGANTYTWANTNSVVPGNSIIFSATTAGLVIYTLTGVNTQGCEASITVAFNINACTGLNEFYNTHHLTIYPNPNNGEFIITSQKEVILSLINELGQVIKKLDVNSKNNYQVSVTNIPNGVYFIMGEGLNKKIVVSK